MTKEQLSYINGLDSKKEIKNQLNEWFGVKELEVGKWYKRCGELLVWNNGELTYGFNNFGFYLEEMNFTVTVDSIPATQKEVEEALKKEAVKRGFAKGVNFKSTTGYSFYFKDFWFSNILGNGNMWNRGSGLIFDNGKWGEVIQTITKEEAEKQLGKIIV